MKVLLKYLGYILLISSPFRLIPIISAIVYGESFLTFILTALISFGLGISALWVSHKIESNESGLCLSDGFMLVALSFILMSLIGTISFLPSMQYNFVNAFFESTSGFTTTGLTIYSSLDTLPKSLLLWRAETQWMGGIGIVMVFLFILSRLRTHSFSRLSDVQESASVGMSIYQAQGFPEKLEPGLKRTTRNVLWIYGGYTVLGIILLLLTGMSFFDSIAMSFTSLSTGGFAVKDQFYTNNAQLVVLCIMMLLGSISFISHNKLIQRKFKEFMYTAEKNFFFVILAITILIALATHFNIKTIVFELISAFTTTGYSTTAISLLPQLVIMLIMVGMVIGGGMGSTAGGIKVYRVFYLLRSIPWLIRKLAAPARAIIPFKIEGKAVDERNLVIVEVFLLCYILTLFLGTIIFMMFGYSLMDSSFQMTSALGTVGLQTMSLATLPVLCKFILLIAMLLGRLEIFPLLILIRSIFKKIREKS